MCFVDVFFVLILYFVYMFVIVFLDFKKFCRLFISDDVVASFRCFAYVTLNVRYRASWKNCRYCVNCSVIVCFFCSGSLMNISMCCLLMFFVSVVIGGGIVVGVGLCVCVVSKFFIDFVYNCGDDV